MKYVKRFVLFLALCAASSVTSCRSGPIVIPEGASPDKIIQLGQEASDKNKYDQALSYYQAVIDQFPSYIDSICAAEYEIAFIHYKRKKYSTAKQELNDLLFRYEGPDEETLPNQYKVLATIVLKSIEDKEVGKKKQ
jgi:outer membrane protein assembly factor BamD (BamD/ComL family)